ncbi:hypothetical protein OHA48_22860 [Streptomyces sp. NBC_00114]|nr:hypothetical protein [Streptomyces sp. NBC_00078]MCX5422332.1 hypothetical protein [Streptomyces sp. NBC_00078]
MGGSVLGFHGQRGTKKSVDAVRSPQLSGKRRRRWRRCLRRRKGGAAARTERLAPGQQLVGDDPEGVYVGPAVEPAGLENLFGRHVCGSARGHGQPGRVGQLLRAAEVRDEDGGGRTADIEQEVRGLDVTVDDACVMEHLDGVCGLGRQTECLRGPAVPDLLGQRAASDVVHDEVGSFVLDTDVVNAYDTWAGDPSEQPRLRQEPLSHVGVRRPVVGQHLDRYIRVEFRIVCSPDRRERTGSQSVLKEVTT